MNSLRPMLAAVIAAFALTASAIAADIAGAWTWTMQNRRGPQEVNATFALKDGVLTGTVTGRLGEVAIGDASLKDDKVHFTVTREINGAKIVMNCDGKFEGDTNTGKLERPGFNEYDAPMVLDWKATRVK